MSDALSVRPAGERVHVLEGGRCHRPTGRDDDFPRGTLRLLSWKGPYHPDSVAERGALDRGIHLVSVEGRAAGAGQPGRIPLGEPEICSARMDGQFSSMAGTALLLVRAAAT